MTSFEERKQRRLTGRELRHIAQEDMLFRRDAIQEQESRYVIPLPKKVEPKGKPPNKMQQLEARQLYQEKKLNALILSRKPKKRADYA